MRQGTVIRLTQKRVKVNTEEGPSTTLITNGCMVQDYEAPYHEYFTSKLLSVGDVVFFTRSTIMRNRDGQTILHNVIRDVNVIRKSALSALTAQVYDKIHYVKASTFAKWMDKNIILTDSADENHNRIRAKYGDFLGTNTDFSLLFFREIGE